jgi:hypothetical protein
MIRFISTSYIHTVRDYRQYSAIAILHNFQFTVTHTLRFSVFANRILATDLSQSHCHFKSQNSTQFFSDCCSVLPAILLLLLLSCRRLLITTLHGPHGKHRLLFLRSVFTAPLPGNRRSIFPRVCFLGNVVTDPLPSNGYTRHNIKMYQGEIGWDGMDRIDLAQDMDQWRALVNMVMNLRVL